MRLARPAMLLLMCGGLAALAQDGSVRYEQQWRQYEADVPKTILELQPFRTDASAPIERERGERGAVTLTNLNPNVQAWYLLSIAWPGDLPYQRSYHLQLTDPRTGLALLSSERRSIRIGDPRETWSCTVWTSNGGSELDRASASGLPFAPLCEGRLYLRNAVAGHRSMLEHVTDFLRDYVWQGDEIVSFVKRQVYQDAYAQREDASAGGCRAPQLTAAPAAARTEETGRCLRASALGLDVLEAQTGFVPGHWYGLRDLPGVFASVISPADLAPDLRDGRLGSANALDRVESKALVFLTAFDLTQFSLHFVLGTEHPRVDWSPRPPPASRDGRLPGPDGISSIAPLVASGMVPPFDTDRTVAAFAGGFKREHGAFRSGPLAQRNHGSHYGFLEQGTVFSKLQPGLATLVVDREGQVAMRTWTVADALALSGLRDARQNGVPLIDYDAARKSAAPGALVGQWGPGNWSGSADEVLRTLRSGVCLQQLQGRSFLIFGYFSTATPSAMARVFLAYGCRYAMHLDMNALEHTYLAVYVRRAHERVVEHLVQGMEEVDQHTRRGLAPRFLAFPDNRDFFYLTRERPQ